MLQSVESQRVGHNLMTEQPLATVVWSYPQYYLDCYDRILEINKSLIDYDAVLAHPQTGNLTNRFINPLQ